MGALSTVVRRVRALTSWTGRAVRSVPGTLRRAPGRVTRRGAAAVLAIVLAAAALIGGAVRVEVDTGIKSFLATGDPSVAAMDRKAADFGGDPIVVLLRSEQPRELVAGHDALLQLLRLEGGLSTLPDVAAVYGPATVVNQLAGAAQNMLASIAGRSQGARIAAEQEAARQGALPDAVTAAGERAVQEVALRYAPLIVKGLPVGLPTLNNPGFAGAVIFGADGAPRPQWKFVVPDEHTVALLIRPRQDLDQSGTGRLVESVRTTVADADLPTSSVTASGVPAVTADLTDAVVSEVPLLAAVVAVVVLLRFLLVPGSGTRRERWWPLAATALGSAGTFAVFGWLDHPMSFGAVALLPVLLGIGSAFPLYLAALRDRRTVLSVAAASAAAFGALALSPLPFVRDLGLALALGVVLTAGAALLLRVDRRTAAAPEDLPTPVPARPGLLVRLGSLGAALVVAGVGWAALPRLDVRADPQELAGGLTALASADEVERVLGSSGEVGIVLRGPDVLSPAALDWARRAQQAVITGFGDQLRPVLGAPDLFAFLGPDPTPQQVDAAMNLVPTYLSSSVVRPDRQASIEVFGARLQDIGAQTDLLDRVRAALPAPPARYEAELVGLPVAAGGAYDALLADRYLVNLVGIALAGLALAVGLRRRADTLRAVLTGVMATGWGFALLWLLGIPLNPLTIGLGALVTVTGCEFVVVLARAQILRRRLLRRSVAFACATSAAGYLALALSSLDVARQFGMVLGAGVLLSYGAARLALWCVPSPMTIPEDSLPTAAAARPTALDHVEVDA